MTKDSWTNLTVGAIKDRFTQPIVHWGLGILKWLEKSPMRAGTEFRSINKHQMEFFFNFSGKKSTVPNGTVG